MKNAEAGAAAAPRTHDASHAADRDWLARPEADLSAMLRNALAQARGSAAGPEDMPRLLALIALMPQAIAARALVRAGRMTRAVARAGMRSDFARGYLLALAAGGGDPVADAWTRRQTLIHLHAALFGTAAARDLARRWTAGAHIVVGAAFGDGLLAAEADLATLAARLRRGDGPAAEGGLLRWFLGAGRQAGGAVRTLH